MKRFPTLFFLIILSFMLKAGNPDSLSKAILVMKDDSNKVRAYVKLALLYKQKDPDKAIESLKNGIALSAKIRDVVFESYCNTLLGSLYRKTGNTGEALKYFDKAIELRKPIGDVKGIAYNHQSKGLAYKVEGEFDKAINEFSIARKTFVEIKDTFGLADIMINMGNIYSARGAYDSAIYCGSEAERLYTSLGLELQAARAQVNVASQHFYIKELDKAFELYAKSYSTFEKLKDKTGMATCFLWQGSIYGEKRQFTKAIESFTKAKKLYEESGGKYELAFIYSNLGSVYTDLGNYKEALKNYTEGLKLREENGIREGMPFVLERIGSLYILLKDQATAMKYLQRSENLALEMKMMDDLKDIYKAMANSSELSGNFEKAYYYQKKMMEIKDSLYNESNNKTVKELVTKYDSDKKQKEIELLNKDKALQDVKLDSEKKFRYMMSGVIVLVLILAIVLFRGLVLKQKSNKLLQAQKEEISMQRDLIEAKQKEMLDSIHYAKKIQQALITNEHYIDKSLKKLQDKK